MQPQAAAPKPSKTAGAAAWTRFPLYMLAIRLSSAVCCGTARRRRGVGVGASTIEHRGRARRAAQHAAARRGEWCARWPRHVSAGRRGPLGAHAQWHVKRFVPEAASPHLADRVRACFAYAPSERIHAAELRDRLATEASEHLAAGAASGRVAGAPAQRDDGEEGATVRELEHAILCSALWSALCGPRS
mgnify:CR=1 FL=1